MDQTNSEKHTHSPTLPCLRDSQYLLPSALFQLRPLCSSWTPSPCVQLELGSVFALIFWDASGIRAAAQPARCSARQLAGTRGQAPKDPGRGPCPEASRSHVGNDAAARPSSHCSVKDTAGQGHSGSPAFGVLGVFSVSIPSSPTLRNTQTETSTPGRRRGSSRLEVYGQSGRPHQQARDLLIPCH